MKRSEARGLLEGPLNHLLDPAKRPLIEAFSKGEEIQIFHNPVWDDGGDDVSFTCSAELYRVKPKPKTLYVINRRDGSFTGTIKFSLDDAKSIIERYNNTSAGTAGVRPYYYTEYIENTACK